ncbi:MAG: hypothetical protein ATN34_01050 [Epulopiscium sp. Nele67-Bin002]|nr:MAG: hypothetical protein ATN34_01050 [Epulopiscium sp. Nele67-Bin002]
MSDYTLSRRDPQYVGSAKEILALEEERKLIDKGEETNISKELEELVAHVQKDTTNLEEFLKTTGFGSLVYAVKPGDGSAREQAASCQKVLGGLANISVEYATKRYRSNLVNWGILPFTAEPSVMDKLERNDYIYLERIKDKLANGVKQIPATLIKENGTTQQIQLNLNDIEPEEKEVLLKASLINFYKN